MNTVGFIAANIIETLLRLFPFPARTGLIRIGSPDRNSPVLLTCNYHLTVTRVKRLLRGMDAYLLVANSRGINVWCAATGGLFTNHDVISVLKTSGVEELVDHRHVILPQLAAAGVEAKVIQKKTGWRVIWGPVHARNIPVFVQNDLKKSPNMRQVEFPLLQRIEMAIAWAFPISLILALISLPFWPEAVFPLILLVWGLALVIYAFFPFYEARLRLDRKRKGPAIFSFERVGIQLILWIASILAFIAYGNASGQLSWGFMLRWSVVSLIVIIVLCIDFSGSAPVIKSGLHEDRLFTIVIDTEKCKGAGFCEQVCPRDCYAIDQNHHKATMPGAERCVQCGACIVQCPFDAISFKNPNGETILPETIRRFKLNLMGERAVKAKQA